MTNTPHNICVITGSRAEYGLLKPLMDDIQSDPDLDLLLIVTGMHLSLEFGRTIRLIEADGFTVHEKVEMLLSSDTKVGVTKSMGLGLIGLADALDRLKPDMILLLGDRFETFAAAAAALIAGIPVAHLHGGEVTAGAFDDALRHSITKMSHLHFVSTEDYRRRVIQLGEHPDRVFHVGALGVENIKKANLFDREALAEVIGFNLDSPYFLVTFHPATWEAVPAEEQFTPLLAALNAFPEYKIIFTRANADPDGRVINRMIDSYSANDKDRCVVFTSMGQLPYLSALRHTAAVIGNSSSGIIEAPTLAVPVVNIGNRQKGRVRAAWVIDAAGEKSLIVTAIKRALSPEFQTEARNAVNPYDLNGTGGLIISAIKAADMDNLAAKTFHDLK